MSGRHARRQLTISLQEKGNLFGFSSYRTEVTKNSAATLCEDKIIPRNNK
jgi:hypothetical protein